MSGIDGIFAVKGGKAFEAFDHSLPVPAGEVGSADSAAKKSIAREHHALGFFEIAHAAEGVAGVWIVWRVISPIFASKPSSASRS